jgi:uncharacterized membrane protein YdjX (TVP38/TMEM64 family)
MKGKILIVSLILLVLFLYWFFNLGQFFSLSYIKASQAKAAALYNEHQAAFLLGYVGVYILVTTLSLPGAAVLTLAGGGLFGFWLGAVVVSFASTIGATLACFVSRYLLREWVQKRLGERLRTIHEGIGREGSFYLFTLRLIPVFPFFVVNLVMGLTRMPLRTFYWVSQLGMLPGTLIYVNAGKELAEIDSPSGILSPGLILSLALLGIFPLAARRGLSALKKGAKTWKWR